ncbi:MAG: RHS repeat domain-containing protein [Desulfovibrio sp.]
MYNDVGQLIRAGSRYFKYDIRGNLVQQSKNGRITHYGYEDNHLADVQLPNGRHINYHLNDNGQRIGKIVNGQLVEKYFWDGLTQLCAVLSQHGVTEYRYGAKKEPVQIIYKRVPYLLYVDQVGTPITLTNQQGGVVTQYHINSFGLSVDQPSESSNPLFFRSVINESCPEISIGFAGGLYDKDTGLVHFGMREYLPEVGRFTSPDPLASSETASNSGKRLYFTDPDVYGYCSDDPVNVTDRTGLWSISEMFGGNQSSNMNSSTFVKKVDNEDSITATNTPSAYEKFVNRNLDEIKPWFTEYIKDTGKVLADAPDAYIDGLQIAIKNKETNESPWTTAGKHFRGNRVVPETVANGMIYTGEVAIPAVKKETKRLKEKYIDPYF